jgi:hypothetical protein
MRLEKRAEKRAEAEAKVKKLAVEARIREKEAAKREKKRAKERETRLRSALDELGERDLWGILVALRDECWRVNSLKHASGMLGRFTGPARKGGEISLWDTFIVKEGRPPSGPDDRYEADTKADLPALGVCMEERGEQVWVCVFETEVIPERYAGGPGRAEVETRYLGATRYIPSERARILQWVGETLAGWFETNTATR